MFLLMSGMADAPSVTDASIIQRMKFMFKRSGIVILITSITDLLAFTIGVSIMVIRSLNIFIFILFIYLGFFSVIKSVFIFSCRSRHFLLLFKPTFLFCPAICLNERRTQQRRHFLFCFKISENQDNTLKPRLYKYCCSGYIPQKKGGR